MSNAVNARAVPIKFLMPKTHVVPFDSDTDTDPDADSEPTKKITDAAPAMLEMEQRRDRGVRVQPIVRPSAGIS